MFEKLKDLKVYEAGKPIELVVREFGIKPNEIIKLASNENPYGPSPKVIEAVKNIAHLMHRYPDDSFFELKEGLAKKFSLEDKNFIIGAGSDQVLEFAIHGVAPKKVLMAGITFAMYEIYSKQVGAEILKTPSSMHNLDEFLEIYKKEKPEIIFLCVPNNPLGECLDADEVYDFIEKIDNDTLVIVDGAYQEFAAYKDAKKALDVKRLISYPNVLYTGTFSKAYGLGGMRVGYGIANEEIIRNLHKLRPPFNITTLSLKAALEALKDEEWVRMGIENNFKEMQKYIDFAREKGFNYIDSFTNFIVLYIPQSTEIADKLLKRGIIVRNMASYGFDALRITIGKPEENDKVINTLREIS
ncbi:histidinol-phosphate transaminase [Caminibacter pacificus]|uniref:Histidinol-phosphate aminotransferase n=1 Tax=Caminibacter pacificus TaxID=1424653 RepID=A0AAJ4RCI1_9BACT|nr:histidinol-phosphate transaminase [Caminibacter pacificus]QCI27995.1 histidinol-phosphate transaminase [Caminibacter pacificus]ROR39819.1 histidinol-phosphate aminotransferase [Caminibacter pacificus]